MNIFENEYYENEEFWKPGVLGKGDQIRIEETYSMLPEGINNLADIGCGNGIFCNYIIQNNKSINVTGIDRSKAALKYVLGNKMVGDITSIPFKDQEFDCVTCLQVIEHLPVNDYLKALSELVRVSNRYVLISVPFNEKIEKNVTQCPNCKTIFNVDLHLRSYSLEDVKNLLSHLNYKCIGWKTTGSGKKRIGFHYLVNLKKRNKSSQNSFNSPICPLCGFKNNTFTLSVGINQSLTKIENKTLIRALKDFILKIWPKKKTPDYWIIALYQRN